MVAYICFPAEWNIFPKRNKRDTFSVERKKKKNSEQKLSAKFITRVANLSFKKRDKNNLYICNVFQLTNIWKYITVDIKERENKFEYKLEYKFE